MTLLILLFAGAALALAGGWEMRRRRRKALMTAPLPDNLAAVLREKSPIYARLPADLRQRLDGLVNRFLDEMTFHGSHGLDVTDEMRAIIAAQACLLIVNKPNRWFTTLKTIFVYPSAFRNQITVASGHLVSEQKTTRSGESWRRGPVVLAWDHAAYGAFIDHDGQNVILHEFAHQLDGETGVTDGAPLLDKDQSASRWARVFQTAYQRLQDDLADGRRNVLDAYGATSPAEFFAVATETFFERPGELKDAEPDLYAELSHYYRLDPASWR